MYSECLLCNYSIESTIYIKRIRNVQALCRKDYFNVSTKFSRSSYYGSSSVRENDIGTNIISSQKEIDIVGEWGGPLKAVEIKSGQTINTSDMKNLIYFKDLVPQSRSYLLYGASYGGSYNETELLSLSAIDDMFE